MKPAAILLLAASALSLTACAYPDADAGGNPNHMAYAGDAGSLYDKAANPPSDIGQASYDAYAPLHNTLPADAALPPPTAPTGAITAAPMPQGNPALRNPANPAMNNPLLANPGAAPMPGSPNP